MITGVIYCFIAAPLTPPVWVCESSVSGRTIRLLGVVNQADPTGVLSPPPPPSPPHTPTAGLVVVLQFAMVLCMSDDCGRVGFSLQTFVTDPVLVG